MRPTLRIFSVIALLAAPAAAQAGAEFKEVDPGFIKMTIRAFLVDQKAKGIEGGYWKFVGEGFMLQVDYNPACFRPTFERRDPAYDYYEEFMIIDGLRAKIWNLRGGQLMSGANYGTERDNKVGLGLYLSGDDRLREKTKEIGRTIFLSISFAPKENK